MIVMFLFARFSKAAAVSRAGAAGLVLVSPLPGEPSIDEIDEGKLLFHWSEVAESFVTLLGEHEVYTLLVSSDTTAAFLEVILLKLRSWCLVSY